MKKSLIIGNWKLNGNKILIDKTFNEFKNINLFNKFNIILFPPLIYIDYMNNKFINIKDIFIGAQNVDSNIEGSFTGEISSKMLKEININYVIIGHSERRNFHKEDDNLIIKKIISVKNNNMIPIICIGENEYEYKNNLSINYCINQIKTIIDHSGINILKNSCIAYEPIWSIGSEKSPSINYINNIIINLKKYIYNLNSNIINDIYFLYGGSVSNKNIVEISNQKNIDGVLIGKLSICLIEFKKIINSFIENRK